MLKTWLGNRPPVMAIVRAPMAEFVEIAVRTVVEAGIAVVEVTLTTPGALDSVTGMRELYGAEAMIGAGTVLWPEDVARAVDAGAQFIVAPDFSPEVGRACARHSVPYFPGAFTPSEIRSAWDSGCTAVKVFPASSVGPGYLQEVQRPLPEIALVPTGGLSVDNAREYLHAGAACLGIGGGLFQTSLQSGDMPPLAQRSKQLLKAIGYA